MIERTFYDERGDVLLPLYRWTREQALLTRSESFPSLALAGTFEELPGLSRKVFVGERRPRPGQIEIALATHGRTHEAAFALQREIMSLAPLIASYSRSPGGTMEIAGFSEIRREFRGGAGLGGTVTLVLECASPYFWQDEVTEAFPAGPASVTVGGMARTGVRLAIHAGGTAVVNPSIETDAGVTRWLGTIPAASTLLLDNLHGGHLVTLNGASAHLKLTGPFPYLNAGVRNVNVNAPGAQVSLTWKEGFL